MTPPSWPQLSKPEMPPSTPPAQSPFLLETWNWVTETKAVKVWKLWTHIYINNWRLDKPEPHKNKILGKWKLRALQRELYVENNMQQTFKEKQRKDQAGPDGNVDEWLPANLQFQWGQAILTSVGFQEIRVFMSIHIFMSVRLLKLGWVDFSCGEMISKTEVLKHTPTTSIKACDTTPVRSSGSQSPLKTLHVFPKVEIRKILFPSFLCSWGQGPGPVLSSQIDTW